MPYQVFLADEDTPFDTEVYKNAKDALDSEEDYCYNELSDNNEPLALRVCEVNNEGVIMKEVE